MHEVIAYENQTVNVGPVTLTVDQIEQERVDGRTRKRVRIVVSDGPPASAAPSVRPPSSGPR